MIKNLTLQEREAVPNKTLCVAQPNGLWTVYQVGDDLPPLPESTSPVPEATRLQFKLALAQTGLLDQVEAYISASTDAALRIYWAEAPFFHRNHPMVVSTAAALGKTEAEIDALFALAMGL